MTAVSGPNLAPMISTAALPSTPATEWAARTNNMLAGADGAEVLSPGPHVPGAFPMESTTSSQADSSTTGEGETLMARAKAGLAGYFGVSSLQVFHR
jgi:hypothetical protein